MDRMRCFSEEKLKELEPKAYFTSNAFMDGSNGFTEHSLFIFAA
jgi:hypothetical protein